MPDFVPSNSREAIIVFHFADRLKAEFLLASRLLTALIHMKEPEQAGGRRLYLEFMRGLEQELAMGSTLVADQDMIRVRTVMTGLIGMVDSGMLTEVQNHFTWIISTMTTYAQRSMEYLLSNKLL
jgi:hypothetical protein